MRTRSDVLEQLRSRESETDIILIVGGGINGLGLYRDLALQGCPAVLVDKGDFASGTSAAPSRLIHGGLRYLETGEFALVKESVIERNHLLLNAPHLVHPLRVWVPAFSWVGGTFSAALRFLRLKKTPGAKGIVVIKLGLSFFDRFGKANQTMPRHRLVSAKEVRSHLSELSRKVKAVAEYYDARVTHPERLALELAGDAEQDCPESIAIPYVSLRRTLDSKVELYDEIGGTSFWLQPSMVVNCAGPWVDQVNQSLGINLRLMGGTKGSHVVLKRSDLAAKLNNLMLYFETHDHRACLIYALDETHVLLGTTDLRTSDPDDTVCSENEITYLFDVLQQVLPDVTPSREDIVFTYAGVRPLPFNEDGATGAISRDHYLKTLPPTNERGFPVLSLVGGKWTTYRACAAQMADEVLRHRGKKRTVDTIDIPVGGGKRFPSKPSEFAAKAKDLAVTHKLTVDSATTLLERYGSTAEIVAAEVQACHHDRLEFASDYFVGEITVIAKNERITRLADIVLRRTLMAFENRANSHAVREIAEIVGALLAWDRNRIEQEITQTIDSLRLRHHVGVKIPS
ncbi:glycerol-3-phosphate dehydrogenase/oxidase [Phyllobacterium lublinensis]|uniref:glycerol-3-phosphate dehydrogenase/oxidase n=1 Tax=Phyllobacterium lublinensis TaxID=2875708 RepID=UPI001CCE6062|nr:glycerol-3-phosphate dehydrogenase/oxidase [Phyllobacterium sp. 2063]MBZ9655260.1 glycerol-3-phosphate dehydrogenase/oxidase [Phyllobacterium sp. 2063]